MLNDATEERPMQETYTQKIKRFRWDNCNFQDRGLGCFEQTKPQSLDTSHQILLVTISFLASCASRANPRSGWTGRTPCTRRSATTRYQQRHPIPRTHITTNSIVGCLNSSFAIVPKNIKSRRHDSIGRYNEVNDLGCSWIGRNRKGGSSSRIIDRADVVEKVTELIVGLRHLWPSCAVGDIC